MLPDKERDTPYLPTYYLPQVWQLEQTSPLTV